jgi:hypothetical protein
VLFGGLIIGPNEHIFAVYGFIGFELSSTDYGQGKDNQQSDPVDQHGGCCQFLA